MVEAETIHPIFRNRLAPETRLWRYLSFAKFVSMFQSKRLHFTRVDQFRDHFEGAWPKRDLEWWAKLLGEKTHPAWFTERMRPRIAASCWIGLEHESAAMWDQYANGNDGVAVTTTFAKLETVVAQFSESHSNALAGVASVTYMDHTNDGIIHKLNPSDFLPNGLVPFMLKNKSYEHEHEVRGVIGLRAGI